jgi:organic hydroperoxide reductase OsmC/OhrA
MEVVSRWQGGYRCVVSVRHHTMVADEPRPVGGTDAGPTPTELLLGSLAACFTMALSHVAMKQDVSFGDDLEVRVEGTYDGPRFSRIAVRVSAATADARATLEDLMQAAAEVCYVSNTIRESATLTYEVTRPQGSPPRPLRGGAPPR